MEKTSIRLSYAINSIPDDIFDDIYGHEEYGVRSWKNAWTESCIVIEDDVYLGELCGETAFHYYLYNDSIYKRLQYKKSKYGLLT